MSNVEHHPLQARNPLIIVEWYEDIRDAINHFVKQLGYDSASLSGLREVVAKLFG